MGELVERSVGGLVRELTKRPTGGSIGGPIRGSIRGSIERSIEGSISGLARAVYIPRLFSRLVSRTQVLYNLSNANKHQKRLGGLVVGCLLDKTTVRKLNGHAV